MSRVAKFLALDRTQRALLMRAFLTVISVRLHLALLAPARWRRRLERLSTPRPTNDARGAAFSAENVSRAVIVASGLVPGGKNCLVRALAARLLMARCGIASELVIGVARDESGFAAHAWLKRGDHVLIGASDQEYAAMALPRRAAR